MTLYHQIMEPLVITVHDEDSQATAIAAALDAAVTIASSMTEDEFALCARERFRRMRATLHPPLKIVGTT